MSNRHHVDLKLLVLQYDLRARNGEFTEPAITKPATNHDTLGFLPSLRFEETSRDVGEFLREILDRTMYYRRRLGIVTYQDSIEHFLCRHFLMAPSRRGLRPIFAGAFAISRGF